MLSQLSALQGAMAARLIAADRDEAASAEETLLTVDKAAERLGVSKDWLFRRSRTLPFVVRLGLASSVQQPRHRPLSSQPYRSLTPHHQGGSNE